jgi:histidyl-tRNA synthetase
MSKLVSPLTGAASGFPEYTPAQQRAFELAVGKVKAVYESFGFTPLETSAVERIETLESKGVSSKEIYGLRRLNAAEGDDGSKDIALRFDLTVPLARYVTANVGALVFPFRRYQVQPVWRGERAQAGRYRQFYQFDIDTIGDSSLPLAADAEVLAAGVMALDALGIGDFALRVNNRKMLEGIIRWARATDVHAAIKAIDDAEKVGWDETKMLLVEKAGIQSFLADRLCQYLQDGEAESLAVPLEELDATAQEGLNELVMVVGTAQTMLPERLRSKVKIDLTIARGLDYYTGTVVETRLAEAPELGSIMSGGRYEDLAANLGKKKLPGVGISIGIARLMAYMLTLPAYQMGATPAEVLVAVTDEDAPPQMAVVARELRELGVNAELGFPGKGLGQQLQTAEKRGLKWAVTGFENGMVKLREFASRIETLMAVDDIPGVLR